MFRAAGVRVRWEARRHDVLHRADAAAGLHYTQTVSLLKARAGVLVAAYPLGTLDEVPLPGGMLTSHLGDRVVVLIGLALMSVSTLVFGWYSAAVVLLAGVALRPGSGQGPAAGPRAWPGWRPAPVDPKGGASCRGPPWARRSWGSSPGPVVVAKSSRTRSGPGRRSRQRLAGTALMAVAALVPRPARTVCRDRARPGPRCAIAGSASGCG